MEKFLVVANWKANGPVKYDFSVPGNLEVAIAAAYPFISQIPAEFTRVAQDVSTFPLGAYTGEVPVELLVNLGVKYCLTGHCERRKYLGETNLDVEKKIERATQNGMLSIICAQTIEEIPENIRNFSSKKFLIMYEPFFAISENNQYQPESPENITAVLTDWKSKLNLECRFLYGGSVNEENCSLLIAHCPLLSGFVVGHASLDPGNFSAIIKKCSPD